MMPEKSIIAAVKDEKMFNTACQSKISVIFDLSPSIETVVERVELCKSTGKQLFVHMDLIEGVGKDKAGLGFLKKCGVDGIISTRTAIIKLAKELGLMTVQRVFIIDTQSIKSATAVLKTNPDMLEIMPGVVHRAIKEFRVAINIPIIAGGLIETSRDAESAFSAGATAISTSREELWKS